MEIQKQMLSLLFLMFKQMLSNMVLGIYIFFEWGSTCDQNSWLWKL